MTDGMPRRLVPGDDQEREVLVEVVVRHRNPICLLYTSDAADERSSVDLGGRRIIKKKKKEQIEGERV